MNGSHWQNENRMSVLRALVDAQQEGVVLSRREVARRAGFRSPWPAHKHIVAMAEDGAVDVDGNGKPLVTAYGQICLAAYDEAKRKAG